MLENFENHQPVIGERVFVADSALVIGDVVIGNNSSVWPMAVIRGDVNVIRIGERTNIQDHCVLHVTHAGRFNPQGYALVIGNNITVGHRVTLHGCTINDFCLIGIAAIIMDGAVINSHNIIGAGSLVPPNKNLESGYLWLGNPVKKIRALTEQEIGFFEYSANYYVELKNKYLKSQF